MNCPKCNTELPTNSVACFKCGYSLKKTNWFKYVLIILPLIAVIIGGYIYISHQMRLSEINKKLEEAIGKDAGFTETIIKVEKDASSITYQELFDLCDKSIEQRTNLIVELRGLYPDIESNVKDKLIEFLNNESELVRNKKQFYRKKLTFSSANDSYIEHTKDTPSSLYGWDYYWKRWDKLKISMFEAAGEMETNAQRFINCYHEIVSKEKELKPLLKEENIRYNGFFEKYAEENFKIAEDAKELAKSVKGI